MSVRRLIIGGFILCVGATALAAALTHDWWRTWFEEDAAASSKTEPPKSHPQELPARVLLTPQARANLKLIVKPIQLETFTRTLAIPATVVDRPGQTDRGVSSIPAG
jgi:hypothetical protein